MTAGEPAGPVRLGRQTAIYGIGSLATPVAQIVLLPVLVANLGVAGYGQFAVLLTIQAAMITVAGLGLVAAFFRSHGLDQTDDSARRRVVGTTAWLLLASGTTMLLLAVLVGPVIAANGLGSPGFGWAIVASAAIALVDNFSAFGLARYRAMERAGFYAVVAIARLASTTVVAIVAVALLHWGLAGALLGYAAGSLLAAALSLPAVMRYGTFRFDSRLALDLLRFGLPLVPSSLLFWVLNLSDRFLLARLSTLAEVGVYAVAYSIGMLVSVVIIGPFSLAWPPYLYALARAGQSETRVPQIAVALSAVAGATSLAVSGLAAGILWLGGSGELAQGARLIPWVATAGGMYGMYYVFGSGLYLSRHTRELPIAMMVAAAVNVGLNLLLIPALGSVASAVATTAGFATLAAATYALAQRRLRLPYARTAILAIWTGVLVAGLAITGAPALIGIPLFAVTLLGLLVGGWRAAMRIRTAT